MFISLVVLIFTLMYVRKINREAELKIVICEQLHVRLGEVYDGLIKGHIIHVELASLKTVMLADINRRIPYLKSA